MVVSIPQGAFNLSVDWTTTPRRGPGALAERLECIRAHRLMFDRI